MFQTSFLNYKDKNQQKMVEIKLIRKNPYKVLIASFLGFFYSEN